MLDTFPVVKFGSSDQASDMRRPKDVEAPHTEMAVAPNIGQTDHVELEHVTGGARDSSEERGVAAEDPAGPALVGETTPTPRHQMTTTGIDPSLNPNDAVMPEAIGRETCPICIVDFEEGDDLRILPCEGKHRFHQTCVDPWLLELSGSCPICRQGELRRSSVGNLLKPLLVVQISMHSRRLFPVIGTEISQVNCNEVAKHFHLGVCKTGFLATCGLREDGKTGTRDRLVQAQTPLHPNCGFFTVLAIILLPCL